MSTNKDMDFHIEEDWQALFTSEDFEGSAIDITGATLRFKLATVAGAPVMTLTESDGFTITSGSDGQCLLRVTPAHQTNAGVAASTRYIYEFRATTTGGIVSTQAYGHLTVLPSLFAS